MSESKIKRYAEIVDENVTLDEFYKQIIKCESDEKYAVYFFKDEIFPSINFLRFGTYEDAKAFAIETSMEVNTDVYLKEIENGELFFKTQWYKGKHYIDRHETYFKGKREIMFEDFEEMDIKEQIDFIDSLGSWDAVDEDFYECICDNLGLNFEDLEDWGELEETMENVKKELERTSKGNYIIICHGKVIGKVLSNRSMGDREILDLAGVEIAKTEEDYNNMPDNGKYDYDDLIIQYI